MDWTRREGILTFVFEAFDEPWKGSPDPMEPEKHWGLFTVDREPKKVMQSRYPELLGQPAERIARLPLCSKSSPGGLIDTDDRCCVDSALKALSG